MTAKTSDKSAAQPSLDIRADVFINTCPSGKTGTQRNNPLDASVFLFASPPATFPAANRTAGPVVGHLQPGRNGGLICIRLNVAGLRLSAQAHRLASQTCTSRP